MDKHTAYSTIPRPDVLEASIKYEGLTRAALHIARREAMANHDWLAMQAITYVMSMQFEGDV